MLEVDEIRSVPIFQGLRNDHLQTIAADAELVELDMNDILFENDNTGKDFYLILAGEIQVIGLDDDYEKTYHQTDPIGLISFLDGTRKKVTAKAVKSSRLLRIQAEDFRRIMEENTTIGYIIYQNLVYHVFHMVHNLKLTDHDEYAWI